MKTAVLFGSSGLIGSNLLDNLIIKLAAFKKKQAIHKSLTKKKGENCSISMELNLQVRIYWRWYAIVLYVLIIYFFGGCV